MGKSIKLFVPGRLCLFGEHSDWAGMYRTVNSALEKGEAIVTGTEQGIYATVEKNDDFIVESDLEIYHGEKLICPMETSKLIAIAQTGGFFSYVAGTAAYINDNYSVGGLKVTVTQMDLPLKSGLSSSAAICVLVARAFNQLYHLNMNIKGEMQAAFRGEQKTPSRCGRLDQACAYGIKPVRMQFDGVEMDSEELRVGTTFHWVIANLNASKDTIKILADLNKCYPFAETEKEKAVQEALGVDNLRINREAIECIRSGDAERLGSLMNEWQMNFDKKVAPACDELMAPVLHSILSDKEIQKWIFGMKGVGSQGDGSVQFLVKNEECGRKLQEYLLNVKGMSSFSLTIKPGQQVKKAVIPLAGFGTRVFPATKIIKKGLFPVQDVDGLLKPALLIVLEQLIEAGIEEVALIVGEGDIPVYEELFAPIDESLYQKLPQDKKKYALKIEEMREKITFIVQKEKLGFGHAVYLTKRFTDNEPVLLLLGDFLFKSYSSENCSKQIIEAYKESGILLIAIDEVEPSQVGHYGIVHGIWKDNESRMMIVDKMVEKPTRVYAEEYLGVSDNKKVKHYYKTFGQYVLTPEVYEELEHNIRTGFTENGEYQLTSALDAVRAKYGMDAFVPSGMSFDLGLPDAYTQTVTEYTKTLSLG